MAVWLIYVSVGLIIHCFKFCVIFWQIIAVIKCLCFSTYRQHQYYSHYINKCYRLNCVKNFFFCPKKDYSAWLKSIVGWLMNRLRNQRLGSSDWTYSQYNKMSMRTRRMPKECRDNNFCCCCIDVENAWRWNVSDFRIHFILSCLIYFDNLSFTSANISSAAQMVNKNFFTVYKWLVLLEK